MGAIRERSGGEGGGRRGEKRWEEGGGIERKERDEKERLLRDIGIRWDL